MLFIFVAMLAQGADVRAARGSRGVSSPGGPGRTDDADASELSKLGYAQELLRAMGGFSSFALSFSIISVLTGIVTTFGVAIAGGGPAALGSAGRS